MMAVCWWDGYPHLCLGDLEAVVEVEETKNGDAPIKAYLPTLVIPLVTAVFIMITLLYEFSEEGYARFSRAVRDRAADSPTGYNAP